MYVDTSFISKLEKSTDLTKIYAVKVSVNKVFSNFMKTLALEQTEQKIRNKYHLVNFYQI